MPWCIGSQTQVNIVLTRLLEENVKLTEAVVVVKETCSVQWKSDRRNWEKCKISHIVIWPIMTAQKH